MAGPTTRRRFLQQSLATAAAFALNPLMPEQKALAGFASAAGYVLTLGGPIGVLLAAVDLFETYQEGKSIRQEEGKEEGKIDQLAQQLVDISSKQSVILQRLADQRIVMREEIKSGFLNNDVREMQAIAQRYKIAVVDTPDSQTKTMQDIVGRADDLATKISTYGVAAVPAYITAIAMQNSIHDVLNSPPEVFSVINRTHQNNLNEMLSGIGPNSLDQLKKERQLASDPDAKILDQKDTRIPILEVVRVEATYTASASEFMKGFKGINNVYVSEIWGYTYLGFDKGGKPSFETYREPAGRNKAADFISRPQSSPSNSSANCYTMLLEDPSKIALFPMQKAAGCSIGEGVRAVHSSNNPYLADNPAAIDKVFQQYGESVQQQFQRLADKYGIPGSDDDSITALRKLLQNGLAGVNDIIAKIDPQAPRPLRISYDMNYPHGRLAS